MPTNKKSKAISKDSRALAAVKVVVGQLVNEGFLVPGGGFKKSFRESLQRGYFLLWREHDAVYTSDATVPLGRELMTTIKTQAA